MTTVMGLMHFTYDMSDQPVAMTGDAPNTRKNIDASYLYDGNMKRVRSIIDSGDGNGPKTIYNVYDLSGRLVHIDEVGGGETDYLHGMGQTLARIKDDGNGDVFTYLHPDHLGSPQVGTNEAGAVSFSEHYTPFGEALLNPAANDNQSGFTGHIKDKGIGLNYMQARYYDPNIGRFLSIDPVTFMDTGNPGMFNTYAYVENDPINMIDRFGLCGTRAESYQDCTIEVDPGQDSSGNDNSLTDDQQSGVDNLTKAIRATGQAIADNGTDEEVAAWESISKFGLNPNESRSAEATALGVNTPSEGIQVWKAGVDTASQNQNDANHIVIHETGHFRQSDIDRRQGIQNRGGGGLQFYNQEIKNDMWSVKSGKRLGTLPKDYKRRVYPIGGYSGP